MSGQYSNEPMLDMYIFETTQNIEQLEMLILDNEKASFYTQEAINEIFRIMHTIKGSSAMMLFDNISNLAHSIEDLFYFLRELKPQNIDCSILSDFVLESVDFIKAELQKIKDKCNVDGDSSILIANIKGFLVRLKEENPSEVEINKPVSTNQPRYYIKKDNSQAIQDNNFFEATIYFENGCEMENIRAFSVIHNLKELVKEIYYIPENIIDSDESIEIIREKGFKIFIKTSKSYDEINESLKQTIFLKDLELIQLENDEKFEQFGSKSQIVVEVSPIKVPQTQAQASKEPQEKDVGTSINQSIISVNVTKLDKLMDLIGEMVIAEAMVTQNPDLKGFNFKNFRKASHHLHKITLELQDIIMSVRMVPLSMTFQKMNRIVRDMSKKLGKEVHLELIGEETEVDKNIIEHISDPLMHLVRNAVDHGIEDPKDREAGGKPKTGKIILEAKNAGSDVLIIIKDDGKGLNKEKILKRARENDLLIKSEQEMTDREIYSLILLPGFSTKDTITEFSGRGVGMDVVKRNIELVGGTVLIDSTEGIGSTITLKLPLTLAIIDGMNVKVGSSCYTIPITTIKESFRPKESDLIKEPDGNELIMVRGKCYPILRLHQQYDIKTDITNLTEGIIIMVEQDERTICIFADALLGQQQVVVKTLPNYIKNTRKIQGLAGCTLLGDGSISLILDIGGLIKI
ncbi:chemotaxis protein CheA [Pseudobacteroides cellulosolvens]|uniref:Chemotaxis protein CheA n=1 Tax=Pseudobacteroides cellulosolvens ATCC 35603 = DSM 2933 TaxID=398512 RepID=A0A0L6JJS5_9FIRM|nr:chemotaxis protein CheA [Pseudobacteroides cellulosolvens]KNY25953.1 CheA signal transduction histidine kinase [Pseudobacteroides cellulosolvens ATCC 35603 = DSM 2933]